MEVRLFRLYGLIVKGIHGRGWRSAYGIPSKVMANLNITKEGGANEIVAYLRDVFEWEKKMS